MYVGLDVHKRVCYGTVIDKEGNIIKRGKMSNDPESLKILLYVNLDSRVKTQVWCYPPLLLLIS